MKSSKGRIATSESWPEDIPRRSKKADANDSFETVYEVELTLEPKQNNESRSSVPLKDSAGTSESEVSSRRYSTYENLKKEEKEECRNKPTDTDSGYENLSKFGLEENKNEPFNEMKPIRHFSEISASSHISKEQVPSETLFPEATIDRHNNFKQSESKLSSTNDSIITYRGSTNHMRSQSSEAALSDMNRELLKELFLGALKECGVRRHLKVNEFRLYYKLPSSLGKFPPSLPLKIGYMSSDEKVHHFPVCCTNPGTRDEAWFVSTGAKSSQVVAFSNLPALLRYHRTYSYINPKSGTIEMFPV